MKSVSTSLYAKRSRRSAYREHRGHQQRDKEQADPKRCWPCAESLWSHHAYEPCEERKQTGHEQYNETETFNISPANDHTAIMRLVPHEW
jgi:hypothetical protein